jgi:hypothetical protein
MVAGGAHNPGGRYVYNKSDKEMEGGGSASVKFFFRPSSGLRADLAEAAWHSRLARKDLAEYGHGKLLGYYGGGAARGSQRIATQRMKDCIQQVAMCFVTGHRSRPPATA